MKLKKKGIKARNNALDKFIDKKRKDFREEYQNYVKKYNKLTFE